MVEVKAVMEEKLRCDIVGKGRVGSHLFEALRVHCDTRLMDSRSLYGLRNNTDICLICVSDNAIADVARSVHEILNSNAVLAHTSGSVDISQLPADRKSRGVFYPLQTFTRERQLDYSTIPMLIEGNCAETEQKLAQLAALFSRRVEFADSEKRRNIHVASVFACNFTNHLWTIASDYMEKQDLDFGLLLPLIQETASKIATMSPAQAQTGPALRGDTETIGKHLEKLKGMDCESEIYRLMSRSIMNRYL